ncbi:MAG TPA: hypothetical protein PL112_18420 [Candidatus Obscuribacter sp.]|nr:hypothetical protein [Candidatus Obscuribacter sp.]HMX45621.1 hypothetical protein [Candidatus Obscuribacter sp.]HMY52741.1 hypothetical protein [Candidatus Obscuribacter sp.]HND07172.1 hypothetical protein [Candidatus Obscuribacter sp.]HND68785.1 hypothetical protein [Candidatus Obscuribacter sp.]
MRTFRSISFPRASSWVWLSLKLKNLPSFFLKVSFESAAKTGLAAVRENDAVRESDARVKDKKSGTTGNRNRADPLVLSLDKLKLIPPWQ